jgi:transcriptional regulator with XRE-family HTH domain
MADNHKELRSAIFARNVRQLREERQWSQAELGRHLPAGQRLAQSRVAAVESTGSVTIDQAQAFADALQVPVEVLLYAEPPNTKIVQLQRLARISNAVWQLREDINQLVRDIGADLPGKLPSNVAVTADSVIDLPRLPESE